MNVNIAMLTYGRTFLKIKHVPEYYRCKFLFKILQVFVFIICFWNLFIDLESFELCCRRMEETGWTDRVRNEEVLHRVKEDRNMLPAIYRRKANWIGHILRLNCLLKHVIEGKKEEMKKVAGRRGRKRNQILNDLEEQIGYCKLKLEAPDCTQ